MYTPIEMKRNTKYGNNYWEAYSPKLKRNVRFFSDLEYDNWLHIETNSDIVSFCEQPLKIQIQFNGEMAESIFDMWVLYKDNTEEFMEVKYSSEICGNTKKSMRSIRQTNIQKQWCLENNYKYSIKTDKEIRRELVYLNNLKQIIGQVKSFSNLNESDLITITECLLDGSKSIDEIFRVTKFSLNYIIQMVSWLHYIGICKVELFKSDINLQTEVDLID